MTQVGSAVTRMTMSQKTERQRDGGSHPAKINKRQENNPEITLTQRQMEEN